jgi:hypothetical protein
MLIASLGLLGACPGTLAVPLSALAPARPPPLEPAQRSARRVLVMPFEDARGAEWARDTPSAFMPVVSFFHSGRKYLYPEQAGALHTRREGRAAVAGGAFDVALPQLLATTMRKMGWTPNAFTVEEGGDYDYLVRGRLVETRYQEHASLALALAAGLLGAPCYFTYLDLAFEVSIYRADDQAHPLVAKTYRFHDERIGGLYYNAPSAFGMFVRGLERTLPEVVRDLALAVGPG